MILSNKDILLRLQKLEYTITQHSEDIQPIFKYLKQLLNPPNPPREPVGFKVGKDKK